MQVFRIGILRTRINGSIQMAELIAILTFIKLKVLEAIPARGSISVQNLAKATGAQESLLSSTDVCIKSAKTN